MPWCPVLQTILCIICLTNIFFHYYQNIGRVFIEAEILSCIFIFHIDKFTKKYLELETKVCVRKYKLCLSSSDHMLRHKMNRSKDAFTFSFQVSLTIRQSSSTQRKTGGWDRLRSCCEIKILVWGRQPIFKQSCFIDGNKWEWVKVTEN